MTEKKLSEIESYNKNLYTVIYPYHNLSKIFGFSLCSIDGEITNGKIKTTAFDYVLLVVNIVISVVIIYVNFQHDLSVLETSSFIIDKGNRMMLIIAACGIFIIKMIQFMLRDRMWDTMRSLHSFDLKVQEIGLKINFDRHVRVLFVVTVVSVAAYWIANILSAILLVRVEDTPKIKYVSGVYLVVTGSYWFLMHSYISLCLLVYFRFKLINNYFEEKINSADEKQLFSMSNNTIIKFASLHDQLVDVVKNLNFCYSAQIFTVNSNSFCYEIFATFFFYQAVTVDNSKLTKAVATGSWGILFMLLNVCAIALVSLTTRTGKFTGVLIHKAINKCQNVTTLDTLRIFSTQLQHRAPVFECGLFVYDWTTLLMNLAAIASYLVILIQFEIDL